MSENVTHEIEQIMDMRFGRDSLIALATMDEDRPCVRAVNAYYEKGAFYVVTSALSNKMRQLAKNPNAALCGDWFTAHGVGENIGHVRMERHADLMDKLRTVFAEWYNNGHVNEEDPNTCILRIKLTDGVLFDHGVRYDIEFAKAEE